MLKLLEIKAISYIAQLHIVVVTVAHCYSLIQTFATTLSRFKEVDRAEVGILISIFAVILFIFGLRLK